LRGEGRMVWRGKLEHGFLEMRSKGRHTSAKGHKLLEELLWRVHLLERRRANGMERKA
jgi:hypothetical protein